ncbi:MAG TPA: hypothetical protein VHE35_02910, partial [Kofleriaceae bacterium]|nr:hypothetical protein [Kofleriaceae bacterium]
MMRADPASRRGARSFLFAAVVLALAGRAAVADAAPRVTVVGDDPQTVKALADALRTHKDVEVVDVTSAPVVGDKAAAALAAANGLNAVVAVRVSVDGATWTATVVAYDGRGGTEIGRYDAKSPVVKLSASAAAPVWKKLGAAIQAAQAPEPGAAVAATGTTTGTGAATGTEPGTAVVTEPTTTGTGAGTATEPTTGTGTGTGAATGTGTGTEAGTGTGTGTGAETGSGAGTTTGTAAVTTGAGMVTETGTGGGGGPTVVAPVKPHTAGRGAIRIGAALQPFYRRLRYTDDIRNATRP